MCGIVGIVRKTTAGTKGDLSADVQLMASALVARGPDACGSWVDAVNGVSFGHRRLSIIELSAAGAQPMVSASGDSVLNFNGEIYGYKPMRNSLISGGARLRGGSDTEALLETLEARGVEATLKLCRGMFAFGWYDRRSNTLWLARDRVGEKPLYYGWAGGDFVFGSTLQSLRLDPNWEGDIDRDVLGLYFRYGYVPGPFSIYRGVLKLPPGSYLRLDLDRLAPGDLPEPVSYWSLLEVAEQSARNPFKGSEAEAIDELERILGDAVRGQMVSDVPLGAFLSGGIDSSTVVALMRGGGSNVRTFTVGFDEIAYDEAPYAAAVAKHLGTEHTQLVVAGANSLEMATKVSRLYDEPFGDSSQIPTALVSQMARRYVTVCLSGDGGDEVFCGYNRHVQLLAAHRRLGRMPRGVRQVLAKAFRRIPTVSIDSVLRRRKTGVLGDQVQKLFSIMDMNSVEDMYVALTEIWSDADNPAVGATKRDTLLTNRGQWPSNVSTMLKLMALEASTSLPDDMLVKVDRAAMAFSLETRVPMLDHRILEFAWSLPDSFRIRDGQGKWILRKVLHRHVPVDLVERPKGGFGAPIDTWLKGPLKEWAEELISPQRLQAEGYLDADLVTRCWNEHQSGARKWQYRLWAVLMFQDWLATQHNAAKGVQTIAQ